MNQNTAFLLIALNICHWLADYTPLSTPTMLKAKAKGWPPEPIINHAAVHASLMWLVVILTTGDFVLSILVMLFQLFTHAIIDTLKGHMNIWFPSVKDTTKYFHWVIFGLDQLLHQIVIILIAYYATR